MSRRALSLFEQTYLIGVVGGLQTDVKMAYELVESTGSPFSRRAYVRAAFAMVEGTLNTMANIIEEAETNGRVELDPTELLALREEDYRLDDKGKVKPIDRHQPLPTRLSFVAAMFARFREIEPYHIDRSGRGWRNFKEAIRIRNRITHPSSLAEFEVSADAYKTVQRSQHWVGNIVKELMD